jgi:hypothetical protein
MRRAYRWLMRRPLPNWVALKSAYAGQFDIWKSTHRCEHCPKRRDLHARIQQMPLFRGPLWYLEFGVHEGVSLRYWLEGNEFAESRFVGFDSFQGLPETWRSGFPKGHFNVGGRPPEVEDPRCRFEIGWFCETVDRFLREFVRDKPVVVHLDADLYSSTLYALSRVGPRLAPGDVLIIDDFSDTLDAFRAFNDFVSAYGVSYSALAEWHGFDAVALQIG